MDVLLKQKNHTLSLSMVLPNVQLSVLSTGLSHYDSHDDSPLTTSLLKPLWNYPLYTSCGFSFLLLWFVQTHHVCINSACDIFCSATINIVWSVVNLNYKWKGEKFGVIWYKVAVHMVPNILIIFGRVSDVKSSRKGVLKILTKNGGRCGGSSCACQLPYKEACGAPATRRHIQFSVPLGFVQLQRAARVCPPQVPTFKDRWRQ